MVGLRTSSASMWCVKSGESGRLGLTMIGHILRVALNDLCGKDEQV